MFGIRLGKNRMKREIVINAESLETRVAIMEDGRVEEFKIERPTERTVVRAPIALERTRAHFKTCFSRGVAGGRAQRCPRLPICWGIAALCRQPPFRQSRF